MRLPVILEIRFCRIAGAVRRERPFFAADNARLVSR
jgi:hypothetical protein